MTTLDPIGVARVLRCRTSNVRFLIKDGWLPAVKRGPKWEIRLADVLGFIDEETERQSAMRRRRQRDPRF